MSIWAPVVAALGSSLLTGGAGFGTIWWQQRKRDKAMALAEISEAYHQLIASSLSFVIRARTLRDAMRSRSGLGEGLQVTLRIRQPLDPLEFHDWLARGFEPMNQAWSQIEVIGSPEAVARATQLLDACADLVGTAGQPGTARGKIATVLKGLEWTAEEQQALQFHVERIVKYRSEFVLIAREQLGRPALGSGLELATDPGPTGGSESAAPENAA